MKLVDPETYALAQHFLDHDGADAQTSSLAEAIQTAVEDWFTLQQIEQGDGPDVLPTPQEKQQSESA